MAIDFDSDAEVPELEVATGINTTPLIDVMLVLLVMLIITIPVHFHAVSMEVPTGAPASLASEPVLVRIEISAANQLLWNGEPLADRRALETRLLAASQLPQQPEIHIHGHRASKYDTVAAVLSSAQRLGLLKIGVVGLDEYAEPR